jgi:hypothetical protein
MNARIITYLLLLGVIATFVWTMCALMVYSQEHMTQQMEATQYANCNTSNAVIIMSGGRSGSSFINDVLSQMFLNRKVKDDGRDEILGASQKQMELRDNPLAIIKKHFCPQKGKYVSFKWKPHFWNEEYFKALRWVAEHNIPIIYNIRNSLDVVLSNEKHNDFGNNNDLHGELLPSHCAVGNATCLSNLLQRQLVFMDPKILLTRLSEHEAEVYGTKNLLINTKVNFISVNYEDLVNAGSRLRVWKEIFEFVAPHRQFDSLVANNITTAYAATSSSSHRDKIQNYDEIRDILRGTRYASLLH